MKQSYEQGEYSLFYQKRGDARADERNYLTENGFSAFVLALEYEKLIRNVRERDGGDPRYDVYDERPPAHVALHARNVYERVEHEIIDKRRKHAEYEIKHYFLMLFYPRVCFFKKYQI